MKQEKTCPDANQKQVFNVLRNDFTSTENDFECGIAEFKKPDTLLIPDGEYELMLDYYETAFMFQKKAVKLVMHFKILSHGAYFGQSICRFYNIKRVIGKPSKGGNFEPSARSDFIYELMCIFWRT